MEGRDAESGVSEETAEESDGSTLEAGKRGSADLFRQLL
jgi:hypothetical protein